MDFYAILDQVIALLRQRQRVTYRALPPPAFHNRPSRGRRRVGPGNFTPSLSQNRT